MEDRQRPDRPRIPTQADVGLRLGPFERTWTPRDVILYALSIGARLPEDLAYVYEGTPPDGPRVVPTFALALLTPLLEPLIDRLVLDRRRLLHVGQSLEIERMPAPTGTAQITRELVAVADKGRARLLTCRDVIADCHGSLAQGQSVWWVAAVSPAAGTPDHGAKPNGSASHSSALSGDPNAWHAARAPDRVAVVQTTTEQAALHRLNGDLNPVHIDPELARAAGQPRPFLHGLATFGILALELTRNAPEGARLTTLAARFTAPVFPGQPLTIATWTDAPLAVAARVRSPHGVVLDRAEARYEPFV